MRFTTRCPGIVCTRSITVSCHLGGFAVVCAYDDAQNRKVTVDDFEQHRAHLRGVAYRMLGSFAEADDAVQEAWLRYDRAGTEDVRNLRGWLTTVVSRICLDMLRARSTRREDPLEVHLPDPIVTIPGADPEQEAVLADSVGLAMLVVLDTLSPAERLAFVLHDVFGVPFEQIAQVLDRSPGAAKQLASRARSRVRATPVSSDTTPVRQREILNAFRAASREGDFDGLLAVLHPDVLLRADAGSSPIGPSQLLRGAAQIAGQAMRFAPLARDARDVLVNGWPGVAAYVDGRMVSLLSVIVVDDRIVELNILADPERLARLELDL
jgi:RNA polymerase sigma-70 factor (ECF subfamily)